MVEVQVHYLACSINMHYDKELHEHLGGLDSDLMGENRGIEVYIGHDHKATPPHLCRTLRQFAKQGLIVDCNFGQG